MTTTHERTRSAADTFKSNEIRTEGHDKVSGRTKYTADMRRPDTLWAAFTISPYAHAKIVSIDISAALDVPGVKAVLTGKDIGDKRHGRMLSDWAVLAYEKVVFIGDRVAAVAAETREAAEEAARLVEVEYEELPAIIDLMDALLPDAPIIHPDGDAYHYAGKKRPSRSHPNVQGQNQIVRGAADLEPLFAGAYRVFERTYRTPRQHAGYMEPRSTLVWIEGDVIHVCSPNKSPFKTREFMAHVTGSPPSQIVVESSNIGGDFGGKGLTVDEFPCYFLAKATGRPVRYVETYTSELMTGAMRHPAVLTLRTAVNEDGTFLAHTTDLTYGGGAYAAAKPGGSLLPGGHGYSTVGYRVPNVRLDIRTVYTNTVPCGHVRAPCDVQIYFAWEQHVDEIAASLNIDPVELRLRNIIGEGEPALTNEYLYKPAGRAVLEKLKSELATNRPMRGRGFGRGISLVCRHTGGGKTAINVQLKPSGEIFVVVGVPDQGSGSFTVVQRIMGGILGIDPLTINVRRGTTAEAPNDPGSGASRVTNIVGIAAIHASELLQAELTKRTGLQVRDGVFIDEAGRTLGFPAVMQRAALTEPIDVVGKGESSHDGPDHPADYTFSAFSFDIDVDAETGSFEIIDTLFVTDVGMIINPIAHQGQIDGGFVFGFGGAVMEELPLDESGKPTLLSLGDYKLPTINDLPPFRTVLVPSEGTGPYGAKMAGEMSNSGVAPGIVNAVYHAVGVRLDEFPITPERIYDALTAKAEHVV